MNIHIQTNDITSGAAAPTIILGGLPITVMDRDEAANYILTSAATRPRRTRPLYLTSANGEVLAQCHLNPDIKTLFTEADQILADGQPMVIASRFVCKQPLPERVATTDLFHDVAQRAQRTGQTFYFFGATEAENARAVAAVQDAYPKLKIAGRCHGFLKYEALDAKLDEINDIGPDVLWLAMGIPREQQFMAEHGHKLNNVGVVKTSGGLFNFLSGSNSRAPRLMQAIGLEWVWRLILEPRRLLWRYLSTNPMALMLMLTRSR